MLAAVYLTSLVAVVAGAPLGSGTAQGVYQQDYIQQYPTNPKGAQTAFIIGTPQNSRLQPVQQEAQFIQYAQPQEQLVYSPAQQNPVSYKTLATPAAAPKSLTRNYKVHEVQEPQWAIVRQSLDNNFDGHFQYDYETENGISMRAIGAARQLSPKEQGQGMQGSYSYTAPDGRLITTSYTADENGFVAYGDHLPMAPEVPELPPLIAKSLAYIRSQPPQPENQQ